MTKFTYIGDPGREYPTLQPPARDPAPGTVYDLAAAPDDGRWQTGSTKKTATPSAEEK